MFFKGIITPRNKELMSVLSDLEYVEQTGYGVPEVLKHYDKNIFDIEENYINVSIPYDAEVMASIHVTDVGAEHDTENDIENDTEKTIISAIKSNPYVSQEALAKLCNKSRITISRIIKKSNKIKRVGPDLLKNQIKLNVLALIKVVIGKSYIKILINSLT